MRNRGYVKRGTGIDVQIRDEYFVTVNIKPINEEKTEFTYELSIRDRNAGISVELDKIGALTSTYKTVNKDTTMYLNKMIDNGDFNEDVNNITNMLEHLHSVLEIQREHRNEDARN